MDNFNLYCPIKNTKDRVFVDAVGRFLWPVRAGKNGEFSVLAPGDLVRSSFFRNAKEICKTSGLVSVGRIVTVHKFSDSNRYTPSVAEIVLQAKISIERLRGKGFDVVAFSNVHGAGIVSMNTKQEGMEEVYLHKGITTFYTGNIGVDTARIPLLCRGIFYDQEAVKGAFIDCTKPPSKARPSLVNYKRAIG